jgi:hypothetical protein
MGTPRHESSAQTISMLASSMSRGDHGGVIDAGYSKRPLSEKLGIKPGTPIIALGAPSSYPALLGKLPPGVTIRPRLVTGAEFIHRFSRRRDDLASDFPGLARALADDGTLWISWPKKASGVETDLNENIVRDIGLAEGLVDVKVCAIDEVWSGLKFVRRRENRGK